MQLSARSYSTESVDLDTRSRSSYYSGRKTPRTVPKLGIKSQYFAGSGIFSTISEIPTANTTRMLKRLETKGKHNTQVIVHNCDLHQDQILKFINVASETFGAHCEVCIVDKRVNANKMDLERIVDLQDKTRGMLMSAYKQLKDTKEKVEETQKEISITNASVGPILKIIDELERQTRKEVDVVFKHMRERFRMHDPFRDTKGFLKEKMKEIAVEVHALDAQNEFALSTLQKLLMNEREFKEDIKNTLMEVNMAVERIKKCDPAGDKQFKRVLNGYNAFFPVLKEECDKLLVSILHA